MAFVSLNPATGRPLARYPIHRGPAIERTLARAHAVQAAWARLPLAKRALLLRALGRTLLARRDELADLATAEMGKPITQSRAEVEKCALLCDYYAKHGARLLADERPIGAPPGARVTFEPLGTVLAVMP